MNDEARLLKRYENAKGNWDTWRSLYDEAYQFAFPNKNPWPEFVQEGARKNIGVYDTTLVDSSKRLVSRLHSSITPIGQQWFMLEAGKDIVNSTQRDVINAQLQYFSELIFEQISSSKLDLSLNEMYEDLIIGTGALMILPQPGDTVIRTKAISIDRIYPEGDAFDEIKTVWRDFCKVRGEEISSIWPNAKITDSMKQKMSNNPDVEFDFIEGIVFQYEDKKYRHVVIVKDSREFIIDSQSDSSPWVVARWSKTTREVGGRGPVIQALPTMRSLNKHMFDILVANAYSTGPTYIAASDGVFNPYNYLVEPNKVIQVSRASMGQVPLTRLDTSTQIQEASLTLQDLRMQVKALLYDNPIRPVDAPEQTATEVMLRNRTFLEEISPAFARMQAELLPQVINRIIYIMQDAGLLPRKLRIDGKMVQIRFKSPLVQSAALQKLDAFREWSTTMQATVGPQLTGQSMKAENVGPFIARALNVPEELIQSSDDIKKSIDGMTQQLTQNPADQAADQAGAVDPRAITQQARQ